MPELQPSCFLPLRRALRAISSWRERIGQVARKTWLLIDAKGWQVMDACGSASAVATACEGQIQQ